MRMEDQANCRTATMLALLLCAGAAPLGAQATLPATAPTNLSVSQLPSAQAGFASAAGPVQGNDLEWNGKLLTVHANNVGLNALLRSIAAKTGTRLTGSVPEDRIFGSYGPAPMASVLAELLDGLPVNVLFVDHGATAPSELTLTARNGAATPPMPQQQQEPAVATPRFAGPPTPQGRGFGPAAPRGGQQPTQDVPQAAGSSPTATATTAADGTTDSSNPSSPNGVKTPEEIFEQLQKLRATATSH